MSLLVVGSVAFDAVETPFGKRGRMLGGSASHFSISASFFTDVRVVAVVGGDTSGQIARALEIEALEMVGPLEPGAPLCVVRSSDRAIDGLEIAFKGGQVGYDDFFGTLLRGRSNRSPIGATI